MLTPHQKEAYDSIKQWVNTRTQVYCLNGFSGSGKSFLMNQVSKLLFGCVAVAPTHKATQVLKSKVQCDTMTLAKLLGMSPNLSLEEYDPANPIFKMQKNPMRYGLVIVDEASMVGEKLYRLIIKHFVKVLFVGDPAQLAPVKDKINPAILNPNFTLTEIVRTKKSDILQLSADIRAGTHKFENSENITVIAKDDYKHEKGIMLAYTNSTVAHWNNVIRNDDSFIKAGDKVMFYGNDVEDFHNSEEATITHVKPLQDNNYYVSITNNQQVRFKYVLWSPINYQLYYDTYVKLLESGKRTKDWRAFYKFRNTNLVMENLKKEHTITKQLDFAYAITIHKSQGSTYSDVVVDTTDIRGSESKALLYVAATRTSENLTILI
jgi:exodeoxyribonuclease-5